MPAAVESFFDLLRIGAIPTVYLREHWADDWTATAYLYAIACEWVASPKTSSGRLVWDFGIGSQPDTFTISTVAPIDRVGWFVKIEVPQTALNEYGQEIPADALVWVGQVVDVSRDEAIALPSKPKRQTFTCQGPEKFLSDVVIDQSWFDDGASDDRRVPWGLEFNPPDRAVPEEDNRPNSAGNRSKDVGPEDVYRFAGPTVEALTEGFEWSTYEIARYLVKYHSPVDSLGAQPFILELHANADLYLPTWDAPRIRTHGRTLKQVLDAVMDRRRGLGYTVEYEAAEDPEDPDDLDKIIIRPFTYASVVITLPGGTNTIEVNAEMVTLPWYFTAIDIGTATAVESLYRKYDQARAIGDRIEFVLTMRATTDDSETTIEPGWSVVPSLTSQQTKYNEACKYEAWYAALEVAEKQQRNRDFRRRDDMTRVYSYFVAASGWPEDNTGADWDTIFADSIYVEFDLDPDKDRFFYRPMLRLENDLPLRYDVDYTVYPAEDNTPDGQTWEYMRPLVILKLNDDLPSTTGKYAAVDKLAASAGIEKTGAGRGRDFSCSVRMQDDACGFILKVQGFDQHAIAFDDFDGGADATDTTDAIPEYNWDDELIATVAIKADAVLEKRWPTTLNLTDPPRVITVDLSRRCRAVYLMADTIVGVDEKGDLVDVGGAGDKFLRDDRTLLEEAARVAFEWYCGELIALTVSWAGVNQDRWDFYDQDGETKTNPAVGSLLVTVGNAADGTEETINTVITLIEMTFAQSKNQAHRTTIRTQWAELDVAQVI